MGSAADSHALRGLKVAYFGHYDPGYSRNRILIKALCHAGATVVQINRRGNFVRRIAPLVSALGRARCQVIVVGFPGHADVAAAKLVAIRNKISIVFDPLVSLYEAAVEDRRSVASSSFQAKRYLFQDRASFAMADLILGDTLTHIGYFADKFRVEKSKFEKLLVGADDGVMFPRTADSSRRLKVFFYGSYIPLHGVEFIIQAGRLVEQVDPRIRFTLVGNGQTRQQAQTRARELGLRSFRFLDRTGYEALPRLIAESDIVLGIFGATPKATRVIPNKVFDALAMAKPVITADTPAIREELTHGQHVWLCNRADADSLASAILHLAGAPSLRQGLAASGHQLFREKFSPKAMSGRLTEILVRALDG